MKRVFKTRYFGRWMRKTELSNSALCEAVAEMAQGLVDADLGGGVVKKRVALPGRGKSGGARTLVATDKGNRWFFFLGLRKMTEPTSAIKSWKHCRILRKTCLPEPAISLIWQFRPARWRKFVMTSNTRPMPNLKARSLKRCMKTPQTCMR